MSIITPSNYDSFDTRKIVFEPAKQFNGPNGSKFSRIFIKYKYPEGVSTLVLQTPILFSWGISMRSFGDSSDNGTPQMSLVTYNSAVGPTAEQQAFLEICGKIVAAIKAFMSSERAKDELDKWDMDSDVKVMKLFYIKMEKGKPVKGFPPTLYSKLFFTRGRGDNDKPVITSTITDANTGEPIPTTPLLGSCKAYTTLVFSNIFVGAKPSIQTRIGEVMVVERRERPQLLKPLAAASSSRDEEEEEVVIPKLLKKIMKTNVN